MTDCQIVRRSVPGSEPVHDDPLLSDLLLARGVRSNEELGFSLARLPRPDTLPAIDQATDVICRAITESLRIVVVGDYDCDGATSTALAVLALRMFGAADVHYRLPNRFADGYGLSPIVVDKLLPLKPDLIITVDNGVASVEGVAHAASNGIQVVVTDHHLPPEVLPAADAIVNPTLPDCEFPGRSLAGVGVIFYVMLATRAQLVSRRWFESGRSAPNLAELLDLVAIGTVADVVPLDDLNRTLVEQGMRRMRHGSTRPGVKALAAVAGRQLPRLTTADIGFAIGPRLNAAGRLDDMLTGVKCLLAENDTEAAGYAAQLNQLNQDRRRIEERMRTEAETLILDLAQVANDPARPDSCVSICLYQPDWHQGVIGILAGRLKEKLHVPTIIFAAGDDGLLKGSGRSIPALHLRDALYNLDTRHPGLIDKYGGHAMAAGLSLAPDRLDTFRDAFRQIVIEMIGDQPQRREWHTDGALDSRDMTVDTAERLRYAMPWGQAFPEPVFDGEFVALSSRMLKSRHLKLQLACPATAMRFDAIMFNTVDNWPSGESRQIVYRLEVNEFRGQRGLQLQILHILQQ